MSEWLKTIRKAYSWLSWDKSKLDEEIKRNESELKELYDNGKSNTEEWERKLNWILNLKLRRSKLYE